MKKKQFFFYKERRNSMLFVFSICFFLISSVNIFAQVQVSGVVQDAKGESLIGVNVLIKDTRQGTITDVDGKFILSVPSTNEVLEFSYVGFKPLNVSLNGRTSLNITMHEDSEMLDEVVVVGYGTQKKMSVTGSIAQISAEDISKAPSGNISASLAGRLPGLVATQQSGHPGSGATLLIRGKSTTGDSAPMLIVDDVQRSFSSLDPNEIESITILKDATAAAIYGMQGAAGVILVTTKRGRQQKPLITSGSTHQICNNLIR